MKFALKGYRRKAPSETVRCPIGKEELGRLLASSETDQKKLHFLVGYLFLLRSSEVQSIFRGEGSIKQSAKGWRVFLSRSKADTYSKGVSVFFPNECMPEVFTKRLKSLLNLLGEGGRKEPREVNAAIKMILGDNYVFHCLRHGRATDLHREGWPIPKLQVLGRWATRSALVCYLH